MLIAKDSYGIKSIKLKDIEDIFAKIGLINKEIFINNSKFISLTQIERKALEQFISYFREYCFVSKDQSSLEAEYTSLAVESQNHKKTISSRNSVRIDPYGATKAIYYCDHAELFIKFDTILLNPIEMIEKMGGYIEHYNDNCYLCHFIGVVVDHETDVGNALDLNFLNSLIQYINRGIAEIFQKFCKNVRPPQLSPIIIGRANSEQLLRHTAEVLSYIMSEELSNDIAHHYDKNRFSFMEAGVAFSGGLFSTIALGIAGAIADNAKTSSAGNEIGDKLVPIMQYASCVIFGINVLCAILQNKDEDLSCTFLIALQN